MRRWIEGVIGGHVGGVGANCYRAAMTLPGMLYGVALHGRHLCYRMGVFQVVTLPVPVVSVGNVVCGGTGKTQLVIELTERLMKKRRVGIVSRGYPVHRGESMEVEAGTSAQICGDEPKLLQERLPGAIVTVGRDRVEAARLAVERGAEVLVLDDGMQHRRLGRDVEIGIGPHQGHYLPRGKLRDLPSQLARADLVFEEQDLVSTPVGMFSLEGKQVEVPKRVALFCGIGNPFRFVKTVEEMGCEVVRSLFLADHEKIGNKELAQLAKGVDAVVCTEKDRVKLERNLPYPIAWVKCKLDIVGQQDAWETTLKRIGSL